MSRTFLKPEELAQLKESLRPPKGSIDGKLEKASSFQSQEFSEKLLGTLLTAWKKDPDFELSWPILVGSAARKEMAPRSDLDLLFAGSQEAGARFVRRCQEEGIRIRSRFPEETQDWTVGVEVPDLLALMEGQGLTASSQELLIKQQSLIQTRQKSLRKRWLRTLLKERQARELRFDSIANVLEPNLKYGPGGLRDLDQGRQVLKLFPERFDSPHAARAGRIFEYYGRLWTLIRQKLHLEDQGDLLTGAFQFDLARWFQMEHRDFMREIQRGLSRVHFYSNWVFAMAGTSKKDLESLNQTSIQTPERVMRALEARPDILMQHRVRQVLREVFPKSWILKSIQRGPLLERVLRPGASDDFIQAVFQSRLIDRLEPEFKPLVGLVQHDQYHRFTADVHLQQACREFQKTLRSPRRTGPLAPEIKELTPMDRKILGLAVFFHDLMKGREGDHSDEGTELVRREFKKFGWPLTLSEEVAWLVQYHLALSQAAFRKNPRAPSTWSSLHEIGATGARLRRLAVFTVIDIFSTNPEAWTPWKGRLLSDLLGALRSPTAKAHFELEKEFQKHQLHFDPTRLDASLVSRLPPKVLAKDLKKVSAKGSDEAPEVIRSRHGGLWIRLHQRHDQIGFFAKAVQALYGAGLGVRHAAIHTFTDVGIYDWFHVTSRRTPAQIRQMLSNGLAVDAKPLPLIQFDSITLVSEDSEEWIFSFKGKDQPGCLAVAAKALADEGLSLSSARVHTWGRQVDDLFGIRPQGESREILLRLQEKLQRPS